MTISDRLTRRNLLQQSTAVLVAAATGNLLAEETPTAHQQLQQDAAAAPLAMKFTGRTADDCRQWQQQFAARLRQCLGPYQPPDQWTTVVERVVKLEDHVRQELVLKAPGHASLPVYLLLPHQPVKTRLPGVLALHGHGPYGYDTVAGCDNRPGVAKSIESANYDYGRQLVRRGFATVVPCFQPFGRRVDRESYGSDDPCAITFVRMQLLGKVLIAENLRDSLWALELLARQERVDAEKLGCVGLSYGGRMTMLTAALDPRIRVAVVSGALNLMQERVQVRYSCGAQVIPGLLQYGDVPEIGSLIAPRPCIWEIGDQDGLIDQEWAAQGLTRIRSAYAALGAGEQLHVDRFPGKHRWSGRLAWPLLDQVLKQDA
ncbi:dienelactone hydrolase family protein [Lignipirellula cremea]|uniref:Alpha/beta hydrolase family protein n=1 Tax=Lignipirellula cremea TaxID=2528010 RepID=A0A518DTW0_9BACT|nr:alpha/beta hydrolase family protein [Lignipirellula cremea]QDU95275.1 Alpha/beta hydrolase family protein [Lignipirellula cremea]